MSSLQPSSSMEVLRSSDLGGHSVPCLLDLPDVVVKEHLLKWLPPADIRRLACVHPITRFWIHDSSSKRAITSSFQCHPHILEMTDSGPNSISLLLQIGDPNPLNYCTRVILKNRCWDCFKDPMFLKLLPQLGQRLTHLSVQKYCLCVDTAERSFYNSLHNLDSLVIETVDTTVLPSNEYLSAQPVPAAFAKIRNLRIGRIIYSKSQNAQLQLDQRLYIREKFFPEFQSLHYLKVPREDFCCRDEQYLQINPDLFLVPFIKLYPYFEDKVTPKVAILDMQSVREPTLDTSAFLMFVVTASKCHVTLQNVQASHFHAPDGIYWHFIHHLRHSAPPEVAQLPIHVVLTFAIQSLINVVPLVFRIPMPNLKKITVTTCHGCYHDLHGRLPVTIEHHQLQWPQLEELEININSPVMGVNFMEGMNSVDETEVFLNYLFGMPGSRTQMKDLRISFLQLDEKEEINWFEGDWLSRNIATSCKNLTKLELCGWKGDGKSLWPLWRLKNLMEVSLVKCEALGDDTFVGEEDCSTNKEIFLKLSELKSLVLKGLDKMPGITDETFTRVIRHLPLVNFEMTSDEPLKSVTISGIKNLLTGNFAKSIDTFSFHGWSLDGVSNCQLNMLSEKFRSTQLKQLCGSDHFVCAENNNDSTAFLNCTKCAVLCWSLCSLPSLNSTSSPNLPSSNNVTTVENPNGGNIDGACAVRSNEKNATVEEDKQPDEDMEQSEQVLKWFEDFWERLQNVFTAVRLRYLMAME